MNKDNILRALRAFVESRPGFESANYAGAIEAYRADSRRVVRHLQDARTMLREVALRDISADAILEGKHRRIDISERDGAIVVDYCAGQYYAIEFRAAACSMLASVLWTHFREHCGADTGERVRAMARRDLGRSIARRWFI